MSGISDRLIHDIASRVARRVAGADERALPTRYVLVALSGSGGALDADLGRLASQPRPVVAVADCETAGASAVAAALARVPSLTVVSGESAYDAVALVSGAERVVTPSLDLALASRVASMRPDTPAAKVVVRALLAGVPVEASLDASDFAVAPEAPAGAREALEGIVGRLRELGVDVGRTEPAPLAARASAAAYGAGKAHASQERFGFPKPLGELVEFLENRPCSIESGKPCVDCGVCEARGF